MAWLGSVLKLCRRVLSALRGTFAQYGSLASGGAGGLRVSAAAATAQRGTRADLRLTGLVQIDEFEVFIACVRGDGERKSCAVQGAAAATVAPTAIESIAPEPAVRLR
jgi:hypothetical protein